MSPMSSPIIQWRNFRLTPLELLIIVFIMLGIIFLIATWSRDIDKQAAQPPTELTMDAFVEQTIGINEGIVQQMEQLQAEVNTLKNQMAEQNQQLAGLRALLEQRQQAQPAASNPPLPNEHIVKTGETLQSIAGAYKISVRNLMEWNGLKANSVIKEGQHLRLGPGN